MPSADSSAIGNNERRLRPPFFRGARATTVRVVLIALAFGLIAPDTRATTVYKCTARDGSTSYQDRACASGAASETVNLVDDPPRSSSPAAVDAVAPTPVIEAPVRRDTAPAAIVDSPRAWLCTREDDGTRYLSDTGIGQRRAVPLAMLGVPQKSLADAYGRGGAGISAPGVRTPATDRSANAQQLGGAYVWTEDSCVEVSTAEVCVHLAGEIASAERRLKFAFSDTAAKVRDEIAALRERSAACTR